MYLRKLKMKDAPLMLEWMHDESVVHNLHTNFAEKTIVDCERFIQYSLESTDSAHYAIASETDEYMGTVSLKAIDNIKKSAEFAITVRTASMGHGYAWYGMKAIIEKAFNEYNLNTVYWCVSRKNNRAVRFYDKHNFKETSDIGSEILERYEGEDDLKWYEVMKGASFVKPQTVAGCKVINIKTISTQDAGELSFFEAQHDILFDIKRIYYISNVPEGVRRGFHAHKELKQLLFCPYGRIQLKLENELGKEEIELSDPSVGVIIDRFTWREILWLKSDSVLCVAASDYYKAEDYIRDYAQFKEYLDGGKQ